MHIIPRERLDFLSGFLGTRFFEIVPNIREQTTLSPSQVECLYIEGCSRTYILFGEGEPFNYSIQGQRLLSIYEKRLYNEGASSFHFLTNIFSVCSQHSFDTVNG